MPFVAVCPKCEARMRAPTRKRGTTAPCPKCQTVFAMLPAEEDPAPPTPTFPVPKSPGVSIPASSADHDDPLRMALAGVVLVGAAVFASQFPFGRIAGAGLAVVGLLVGGLSLLGLERRVWLGWAGAGGNAVVLVFLVAFPSWFGVGAWTPAGDPNARPAIPVAIRADGETGDASAGVDASAAAWQHADVRLAVKYVTIAPDAPPVPAGGFPVAAPAAAKKERVVRVALTLTNVGVGRAIEFAGWDPRGLTPAVLTAGGRPVPAKPDAEPVRAVPVYPGKSADSVLVFDAAAVTADDSLVLDLPGAGFGGETPAKFRIPRAMIAWSRDPFPRTGDRP